MLAGDKLIGVLAIRRRGTGHFPTVQASTTSGGSSRKRTNASAKVPLTTSSTATTASSTTSSAVNRYPSRSPSSAGRPSSTRYIRLRARVKAWV